jgi:hypothetical protein
MPTLVFDLNPLREFIKLLIENYDLEFSFNFLQDEYGLFIELTKGVSDMSTDVIMQNNKFSYFQGHTHFSSYNRDWKYYPPSANDYVSMLTNYYRFHTKKMLVFEQKGIWEIELNDELKFGESGDPRIRKQLEIFKEDYFTLYGYRSNSWFEGLCEYIRHNANFFHMALTQGTDMVTLRHYIKAMRELGFDVTFTPWEKHDMTFTVDINEDDYSFVNYFVKNRQQYDEKYDQPSYLYIDEEFDGMDLFLYTQQSPEGEPCKF